MLLFHGTGGSRDLVPSIFRDGLIPVTRPWAHEATGIDEHVFASTTPIGSRGGDPIAFAQRRVWRDDQDAWLVVLDVPAEAIRGAVPNVELQLWWRTRAFVNEVFANLGDTRLVIAAMRERRAPARDLLAYRVKSVVAGLCEPEPDAETLVQFERAYLRANDGDKARVAASYRLHLPSWFAEDSHYPSCAGCMHNLFAVVVAAPSIGDGSIEFSRGSWDRVDLATYGAGFDALDRWFASAGDPDVRLRADEFARRYPPPRELVPRTFWPDFATHELATRVRLPDTQVMLGHVAPAQLIGAIHLGGADRLSALVRPSRGETLANKLAHRTRELVELRQLQDRPAILR